jgi:protein disulfide-isomerase A1
MNKIILLLTVLFLTNHTFSQTSPHVTELTNDNFQEAIENNEYILVQFYAPYIGNGKEFESIYSSIGLGMSQQKPPIPTARVNVVEYPELSKKYNVKGYPTFKFFVDKIPAYYKGPRTKESIMDWALGIRDKKSVSYKSLVDSISSSIESHNDTERKMAKHLNNFNKDKSKKIKPKKPDVTSFVVKYYKTVVVYIGEKGTP